MQSIPNHFQGGRLRVVNLLLAVDLYDYGI